MNPVEYVGIVPRAGAWAVDKLLILSLAGLMAWVWPVPKLDWHALAACGAHARCLTGEWPFLTQALLRWLLPAMLTVIFLTRIRATPGKFLLRAEVVDAQTFATPDQRQAWLRTLACSASYLSCGLGHALALFDRRKQTLYDKIAGTVVIRRPVAARRRRHGDRR